jgi:hypothetical protein
MEELFLISSLKSSPILELFLMMCLDIIALNSFSLNSMDCMLVIFIFTGLLKKCLTLMLL